MTPELSEQAAEAIEQISDQHGVDKQEVSDKYREMLEEEREKGVSDPEYRALRRLGIEYKGSNMSRREDLQGYVLGASDPINTSQSAIRRAENFIERKGVEPAVKNGLVREVSADAPDTIAKVTVSQNGETRHLAVRDDNTNSPTHGEILPSEDWIRYVYGAVWRSPSDGPYLFSGVLNGEDEPNQPPLPPVGEPVQFRAGWAGEQDSQEERVRLRFDGPEPFEPMEEFGGPGAIELLEDNAVPLADADASNFGRNDVAITKGSVTYMELAPDEGQNRRLSVVDPFAFDDDLRRTAWLPDHVEVDFAEGSDVYVVGQVNKSNNEYPDSLDASGLFVHPDHRVDRGNIESMADEGSVEDAVAEDKHEETAGDDAMTPAEAGAQMADPSEAVDDEYEMDEETRQEVEEEHGADFEKGSEVDDPDDGYPPVVSDATYTELQSVATGLESVPGSGISEEDMRDQLAEELGVEELGRRLIGDADDADADDGADDGADEAPEPSDEDDGWEW